MPVYLHSMLSTLLKPEGSPVFVVNEKPLNKQAFPKKFCALISQ